MDGWAWGLGKVAGWAMASVGGLLIAKGAGLAAVAKAGLGVYVAKNVAVALIETGIESKIAGWMGDSEFSFGGAFIRNTTVNLALGLLPLANEAKAATKLARLAKYSKHFAREVAANTFADTVWSVGIDGRDWREALPSSLLGNLAGQGIGDLVSPLFRRLAPDSLFRLCFVEGTLVERDTSIAPAGAKRAIEQMVNGVRAKAAHPQWAKSNVEEPEPATWRELTLQAINKADADIEIKLLRPLKWMEAVGASPGAVIDIEIAELNLAGKAKVLAIDPCPLIEPGNGVVVTGTFRHIAHDLVSVYIDGLEEPIQCTPKHPFWSVTRQAFVAANLLRRGEMLQMSNGQKALVTSVAPLAGPKAVYNIEVQGAHVYHVSPLGVLVHNASVGRTGKQTRLRELLTDANAPASVRGWIQQEVNQIARGTRNNIRLPGSSRVRVIDGQEYGGVSGLVLAHRRGTEARKGFGYSHADVQDVSLHKLQHKHEGY